jgi:hypothetical protein
MSSINEGRFVDVDMHRRVVAVVEKAFADAGPSRIFHDKIESRARTYCAFTSEQQASAAIAARMTSDLFGIEHVLQVHALGDDIDAGATLTAADSCNTLGPGQPGTVIWWPPADDDRTVEQFLAWWEGVVDIDENAKQRYEATYEQDRRLPRHRTNEREA